MDFKNKSPKKVIDHSPLKREMKAYDGKNVSIC